MSTKQRLSASVDAELVAVAQDAVAEGHAESISAWVNDALRLKAGHDRRLAALDYFLAAYEAEHGEITAVTKIRRPVPVEEYLKLQKRYAHLFGKAARPDIVARLQAQADHNITRYGLLEGQPVGAL